MFGFAWKKSRAVPKISYDPETQEPVLKSSICTGERVAGFMDISTKKFHDVMLIRSDAELEMFCEACGIKKNDLKKIV